MDEITVGELLGNASAWLADPEFVGWQIVAPTGWTERGLTLDDMVTRDEFRDLLFESSLVRVVKQAPDGTKTIVT